MNIRKVFIVIMVTITGVSAIQAQVDTVTVCGLSYHLSPLGGVSTGIWHALDPNNCWFSSTGQTPPAISSSMANDYANILQSSPDFKDFVWEYSVSGITHYDTLRIRFAPRPSAEFTWTMPACHYDSSMIIAHTSVQPDNIDYGVIYFGWSFGNGELSSTITNLFQQDTIYVQWDSGELHDVTLITRNIWLCSSPIYMQTIQEPPYFNPSYAVNPATGTENNGEVILSTENNTYSYQWLSNTFTEPHDTVQFNLTPNQPYLIEVTGQALSPDATPGTLCHDTMSITVPVFQVASFETVVLVSTELSETVYLLNLSPDAESYLWTISNSSKSVVFTSTLRNPTYVFTRDDCYSINLEVTNATMPPSWVGIPRLPCSGSYTLNDFCLWPSGVSTAEYKPFFSVYPNPISDFVQVEFVQGNELNATYSIFNSSGMKVYSGEFKELVERIDLSFLPDGLYIISINSGGEIQNSRFVKQK